MAVKKNRCIQMRESELRRSMESTVKNAYQIAIVCMLTAAHDKFGFGEKRLYRLLDHTQKISQELNDGDISLEDLLGALKDDNIILGVEQVESARGFKSPLRRRKGKE